MLSKLKKERRRQRFPTPIHLKPAPKMPLQHKPPENEAERNPKTPKSRNIEKTYKKQKCYSMTSVDSN